MATTNLGNGVLMTQTMGTGTGGGNVNFPTFPTFGSTANPSVQGIANIPSVVPITFSGFSAPAGSPSTGPGGSSNGAGAALNGFSFTPPPLVLNGQTVAGGLNFTAAVPIAQTDQASQAYNFINTINNNAYGFVGNAINAATANASSLNSAVVGTESTLGAGEISALNTLAQAEQTAASKINSGGGGLFGALFG